MLIYIPVVGQDLIKYAKELNDYRKRQFEDVVGHKEKYHVLVHGAASSFFEKDDLLSDVGEKDVLYVLAHGRETTANQVGAEVAARSWWRGNYLATKFLTAAQLAAQLEADGLTKRCGDLRLLVCWAGLGRNNGKNEGPFAGQLCAAMKDRGFSRIAVTGYKGAVPFVTTKNVIVEPGLKEATTDSSMAAAADMGVTDSRYAGALRSSGDQGQSLFDIFKAARNPTAHAKALEHWSVWY